MSEDKVRCTKCFSWETDYVKNWKIESPVNRSVVKVEYYRCRACGKGFKVYP